MRTVPVLLISVITHGALLALVADWLTPVPTQRLAWRPVTEPPPPPVHLPRATAEPIEIAFLADEPVTVAAADPVHERAPAGAAAVRTPGSAAITMTATSGGTSESGREPAPGGAGPATSGFMHMRGPDLGLSAGTAERIASEPQKPRDELHKSGKLESQPGGRAVIYDRVTTVSVDADGTAHFDDKKDIDLHFKLPIPKIWEIEEMRKDLGHELTEWFKDPEAGKRYGRMQDVARHLTAVEGACDSWGDLMCDDPLAPQIEKRVRERKPKGGRGFIGTFLAGPMDITAWLHRKYVGDPYASRKLKLLDDTRDERVAMGIAHRQQQSVRSAEYMTRNLQALWAREQSPVARRAALFEMWDECDEDDAGLRARAVVIGWIRSHLPAGSADAYTEAELAALQSHKGSSAEFAPYADVDLSITKRGE
ncbi:MAG TPA: hypothetical protein VFV99_20920 [Kofleriaceae bacterium]|nr:hypothetical protein [Kofleriaceae bacterium]